MNAEVIPVLHVSNVERAVGWWRRLGFEHEWTHRFFEGAPAFACVRAGGRVFLSEHAGDARPDTLLYVWVEDIDPIAADFGVEPTAAEWDADVDELELIDPDGNRLRVGQRRR